MVDCHNLVVFVAVAPADEALVLAALFALQGKVFAVLPAVVGRFGELLTRVHLVEEGIRLVRFVWSLETDR